MDGARQEVKGGGYWEVTCAASPFALAALAAALLGPRGGLAESGFNIPPGWQHQQKNGQETFTAPGRNEGLSVTPAPWLSSLGAPGAILGNLLGQYQRQYPDLRVTSACKVSPSLALARFQRRDQKALLGEGLTVSTGQQPVIAVLWAPAAIFAAEEKKITDGKPACPPAAQATAAPQPALSFVTWRDPNEGAFTVSVPDGWTVTGGLRRASRIDPRYVVDLRSPDGVLHVFLGDLGIGVYEVPDAVRLRPGYREGQIIPAGPSSVTLMCYLPGAQFAAQYIQRRCRGARILDTVELPEEGRALAAGAEAANPTVHARVLGRAATVAFQCDNQQGRLEVGTVLASAPGGAIAMWFVPLLAGYATADPVQAELGKGVMNMLIASFQYDRAWEQRFNAEAHELTGHVIGEQNAMLRGVQARASQQATASLNHPNIFTPSSGVVKPADTSGNKTTCSGAGACGSVSTDHTHYWMNDSQVLVPGPESGEPPNNGGGWYQTR